jgi:hypothetical protein
MLRVLKSYVCCVGLEVRFGETGSTAQKTGSWPIACAVTSRRGGGYKTSIGALGAAQIKVRNVSANYHRHVAGSETHNWSARSHDFANRCIPTQPYVAPHTAKIHTLIIALQGDAFVTLSGGFWPPAAPLQSMGGRLTPELMIVHFTHSVIAELDESLAGHDQHHQPHDHAAEAAHIRFNIDRLAETF